MGSEQATLREVAIMVWHNWSQEARLASEATATEQRRQINSFRTELQRILGTGFDINVKINGGCIEAEIEDLRFVSYELIIPKTKEIYTMISLIGRCPSCGVETISRPFVNMASLGRLLERFEPTFEHFCPTLQRDKLIE